MIQRIPKSQLKLTRKKLKQKKMGKLLVIFLTICQFGCREKICRYILPKNFEGNVAVIFNGTNGRNDSSTYGIPSTGILKTSDLYYSGRVNNQ